VTWTGDGEAGKKHRPGVSVSSGTGTGSFPVVGIGTLRISLILSSAKNCNFVNFRDPVDALV